MRLALKRALDERGQLARVCDEQRQMLKAERRAHAAELFELRRALHEERAQRQQLSLKCDEMERMLPSALPSAP
jgi:hypothetical protein